MEKKFLSLAKKISDKFLSGFFIDQDSVHFLEDSLGISQLEEVKDVLTDKEHIYHHTLVDLIFTVDNDAILKIEPCIERALNTDEVKFLKNKILSLKNTYLIFPDQKSIPVSITNDMVDSFLKKLLLNKNIPIELIQFMKKHLKTKDFCLIKFKLRKVYPTLPSSHKEFLKKFLFSFKDNQNLLYFFDLAISTLQEFKDQKDVFLLFSHKKTYLSLAIKKAEEIEKLLSTTEVEKLIMQKQPILAIDKEKILKELLAIDEIGIKVFNKKFSILIDTSYV